MFSKEEEEEEKELKLKCNNSPIGTYFYMDPYLLMNGTKIGKDQEEYVYELDTSADIYSLGVTFFQLFLSGKHNGSIIEDMSTLYLDGTDDNPVPFMTEDGKFDTQKTTEKYEEIKEMLKKEKEKRQSSQELDKIVTIISKMIVPPYPFEENKRPTAEQLLRYIDGDRVEWVD